MSKFDCLVSRVFTLRAKEERARIARERQGAYQQHQRLLNTIFDIVIVHRGGRVVEIEYAQQVSQSGSVDAGPLSRFEYRSGTGYRSLPLT